MINVILSWCNSTRGGLTDRYNHQNISQYSFEHFSLTRFGLQLGKAARNGGGCDGGGATPWARAVIFVKKPPLLVNVTNLELNGFNAYMWVS